MAKQQQHEVARREEVGAIVTPDYFASMKSSCTTATIGQADVVIPRIKLLQAMSKVKDTLEAEEGDWYNSVSGEVYGKNLQFFAVVRFPSRVWFDADQKMVALETADLSVVEGRLIHNGMVRIGKEAERIIEEHYEQGKDCSNLIVVTEAACTQALSSRQMPDFALLTMMSAAMKSGKTLNAKLKSNEINGIPIFGQLIEAGSMKEKFDKGSAWMPTFTYPRFASREEAGILDQFFPLAVAFTRRVNKVEHD